MSLEVFQEFNLFCKALVAFHRFHGSVKTAINHLNIRENKFKVYGLNVSCRVNTALNMNDVVILETTYNVDYSVRLTNMRKELISETLTL